MQEVIFDCERMKYPHTGLYHFCKDLGRALVLQNTAAALKMAFYLPKKEVGVFGAGQHYMIQHPSHKFFPQNLSRCKLWHSTYQGTNYLPAKRSGTKIIATIHDLNFLHDGRPEAKKQKYLAKTQSLIDKADSLVAISNFVKRDIALHLNTGGKPVAVIYNGKGQPPAELKKPEGDFSTPYFFTIGTIAVKKNFHVLAGLLKNNELQLVIAGINQDENYRKKIMDTAAALGVAERVRLIGPVTEAEKYWLMTHTVLFCFPSIAEGFGIPVIEAMQIGKPVLLSKYTSLPEVGGPHALYLESFDPDYIGSFSEKYLGALGTYEAKAQSIKDWAAQFDWNKAAAAYCSIYQQLLNQ